MPFSINWFIIIIIIIIIVVVVVVVVVLNIIKKIYNWYILLSSMKMYYLWMKNWDL